MQDLAGRNKGDKLHVTFFEKNATFIVPVLLLVMDYLAILLAESTAYGIRKYVIPLQFYEFYIPWLYFYVLTPAIFLSFLHFANTHIRRVPFWKMAENIFRATLYSLFTVIILMYFGGVSNVVSRLFVGMLWVYSFLFILILRYAVKKTLNAKSILQVPVIFIGAGKTAELVVHSFHNDSGFGYKILGFIDDHPISERIVRDFKILGGFKDAENIIRQSGVQSVIITAPGLARDHLVHLINRVQPHVKNIAFVPDLIGTPVGSLEVESLVDEKIMMLKVRNNLARRYNRVFKACFDMVVSLCGLLFVIPLGLLLSVAIYIDSPGPIMFAHTRVGKKGKMFPCYKFRTMVPNAQQVLWKYLDENPAAKAEWDKDFKLKDDPRVTRVGKFLRKTSLDELPQLLNVLKGEMSLVGPRPIVQAEVERYGDYINDYYLVPPGITGMWQVSGRSDTTYDERVAMDSWYVRNWSVWIDIVYLLKTVKVVFERKGAY